MKISKKKLNLQSLQKCNDYKIRMDQINNAHEYLLKFDIKPSVQRMAIMNFLIHNRIHPSVEDIYNALCFSMPTLSKTTVYNTLKLFAEQGALLALVIDEKNVRFDIDTSNHAHFQCVECCKVFDVPVENNGYVKPKEMEEFQVTEVHLYYKGYCKNCRQEKTSN